VPSRPSPQGLEQLGGDDLVTIVRSQLHRAFPHDAVCCSYPRTASMPPESRAATTSASEAAARIAPSAPRVSTCRCDHPSASSSSQAQTSSSGQYHRVYVCTPPSSAIAFVWISWEHTACALMKDQGSTASHQRPTSRLTCVNVDPVSPSSHVGQWRPQVCLSRSRSA
jgi:hypothetical protein